MNASRLISDVRNSQCYCWISCSIFPDISRNFNDFQICFLTTWNALPKKSQYSNWILIENVSVFHIKRHLSRNDLFSSSIYLQIENYKLGPTIPEELWILRLNAIVRILTFCSLWVQGYCVLYNKCVLKLKNKKYEYDWQTEGYLEASTHNKWVFVDSNLRKEI